MGKLTVAKVKSLTEPGLHGDGDTLYLAVAPGGSRSWVQRLVIDGTRRDIGLGGWPLTSLKEAREKAFENRKAARNGGDPLAAKRAAKAKPKMPTFREAADIVFEANRPAMRSEKTAKRWQAQLAQYAHPVLGDMPVDRIGRENVLRVLAPIWTDKAPTARKLRQKIRAIMAWAQGNDFIGANPAGEGIDGALAKQRAATANHRALPHGEVAAALAAIDASRSALSVRLAFRFLVLTAARAGEARGATWEEIDFEARQWRIPASRMKAGGEHRVPLSDAAMAVLEQARAHREADTGPVFPGARRGKPINENAMMEALRSTGLAERATVHGFRSSFRDWCAETGKPRELAEAALAHTVGGVEGAYFRSDLMDRRAVLMAAWADYATGADAKVVELRPTG